MKIEAFGKVTDGQLKELGAEFHRSLALFEGKQVIVTVEKKKYKRSLSQNAYLHLLLTILTDSLNDLGNTFTMLEVKEMVKYKFLTQDLYNEQTGQIIGTRTKATSELSTTEFNKFIEDIIQWGAEMFGFILPYPNDQLEIHV